METYGTPYLAGEGVKEEAGVPDCLSRGKSTGAETTGEQEGNIVPVFCSASVNCSHLQLTSAYLLGVYCSLPQLLHPAWQSVLHVTHLSRQC